MPFRRLAEISAALCGALSIALVLVPGLFVHLLGFDASLVGEVMARRSGVLFAPLALILWTVRDLPEGELRHNFATAVFVMMRGLALLGIGEWLAGRVGPGIFLAVAVEAVLAAFYARTLRRRG